MSNRCKYCGRYFDSSNYYPYCCQKCYEDSGAAAQNKKSSAGGCLIIVLVFAAMLLIVPGMQYMMMMKLGNNSLLLGAISLVLGIALPIITWKINKIFGIVFTILYFGIGYLIYFGVIPIAGVATRWMF